eukprot:14585873-Alexandrium_andersonii.AAC.1
MNSWQWGPSSTGLRYGPVSGRMMIGGGQRRVQEVRKPSGVARRAAVHIMRAGEAGGPAGRGEPR